MKKSNDVIGGSDERIANIAEAQICEMKDRRKQRLLREGGLKTGLRNRSSNEATLGLKRYLENEYRPLLYYCGTRKNRDFLLPIFDQVLNR